MEEKPENQLVVPADVFSSFAEEKFNGSKRSRSSSLVIDETPIKSEIFSEESNIESPAKKIIIDGQTVDLPSRRPLKLTPKMMESKDLIFAEKRRYNLKIPRKKENVVKPKKPQVKKVRIKKKYIHRSKRIGQYTKKRSKKNKQPQTIQPVNSEQLSLLFNKRKLIPFDKNIVMNDKVIDKNVFGDLPTVSAKPKQLKSVENNVLSGNKLYFGRNGVEQYIGPNDNFTGPPKSNKQLKIMNDNNTSGTNLFFIQNDVDQMVSNDKVVDKIVSGEVPAVQIIPKQLQLVDGNNVSGNKLFFVQNGAGKKVPLLLKTKTVLLQNPPAPELTKLLNKSKSLMLDRGPDIPCSSVASHEKIILEEICVPPDQIKIEDTSGEKLILEENKIVQNFSHFSATSNEKLILDRMPPIRPKILKKNSLSSVAANKKFKLDGEESKIIKQFSLSSAAAKKKLQLDSAPPKTVKKKPRPLAATHTEKLILDKILGKHSSVISPSECGEAASTDGSDLIKTVHIVENEPGNATEVMTLNYPQRKRPGVKKPFVMIKMNYTAEIGTQTISKPCTTSRDIGIQTDYIKFPEPANTIPLGPINDYEPDMPNIPELVEYLLDKDESNTTKKNQLLDMSKNIQNKIMRENELLSEKFRLKRSMFNDLKDCVTSDFMGNMPIHNAVLEEDLTLLKRQCFALKVRKISVDILNNHSQTPLQLAITDDRRPDIIGTLLAHGANVNVLDDNGNNLFHLTVLYSSAETLEQLTHYYHNLSKGIDAKNDEGMTPLMLACNDSKYELIECLLENGANPNIRDDKSGRTALFHSIEQDLGDVIGILMTHKADPKIKNFLGQTCTDAARELNIEFFDNISLNNYYKNLAKEKKEADLSSNSSHTSRSASPSTGIKTNRKTKYLQTVPTLESVPRKKPQNNNKPKVSPKKKK